VLPYPRRLRLAMLAASLARPFAPLLSFIGLKPLAAALALAPRRAPGAATEPGVHPARGPRRARVGVLGGCANEALMPQITQAAIRVLNRHGVEAVVTPDAGCCGSLEHHMGRDGGAHARAKQTIDAWIREIDGEGLDAIVVTTSGCGTTIKDYGFMFRNDPAYAAKAARVSAMARDISEYLETLDLGAPKNGAGLVVAYHAACSLQHGQQIRTAPKALLARAGFAVREVAEGHICCGSAGTYNMLQPELSTRLRDRKVANIEATGAAVIAAGNIGCITQIASGTAIPAVHTVELLDWAYGGPRPAGLAKLDAGKPASTREPIKLDG